MGNFIGAIAGDIIGSVYEWHNVKNNHIDFFKEGCRATDDTVLTCAVAEWLMSDKSLSNEGLAKLLKKYGHTYPNAGYGSKFRAWLNKESNEPINSFGNGAGMRCSAVAYYASTFEEAMELAKKSAEVTHNHPEGIKGAQAIVAATYFASSAYDKNEIEKELTKKFGYDLNRHVSDFVQLDSTGNVTGRAHKFDATCQVTVPEAIIAFLDGDSYEDVISKAILIGGDSDTIADMAGAIAGAYYGVPQWIQESALKHLPSELRKTVINFENFANNLL